MKLKWKFFKKPRRKDFMTHYDWKEACTARALAELAMQKGATFAEVVEAGGESWLMWDRWRNSEAVTGSQE